jgi:protease-4
VLAVFGILCVLVLISGVLLVSAISHGAHKTAVISAESWLEIELTGRLDEYRAEPRIGFMRDHRSPTLSEVLLALDHARSDQRIRGAILKPMGTGGFADLREIRDAVRRFKTSGKPVCAYLEIGTDRDYYLVSVADTIVMVPSHSGGMVMLGLGIAKTYLGATFEKGGLKFNVLHVGEYKGAFEDLARARMSDSLRLSLQTLLDDMFETYVTETASDRETITAADLKAELLTGEDYLISGDDALRKRYVDLVMDWQELCERLSGKDDSKVIPVSKYLRTFAPPHGTKEIAIVFAEGAINYLPDPTDPFGREDEILPDEFVKQLQELRQDESVAGVVLRVNSPGGSALASELILQEVKRLKATKPVVVSMGNVAASGGYYISCAADYVVAQPNTITGSIGVVGVVPTAEELYRKVAARVEVVERGKWNHFLRLDKSMTPEQERILLDLMGGVYQDFLGHVAEGRSLTVSDVEAVASGRVWTGKQALERGLVDELGGLDVAVNKVCELAHVRPGEIQVGHYPKEKDWFQFLIERLGATVSELQRNVWLSADERQILRAAEYLREFFNRREFVQLLTPIDTDF